MSEDGDVIVISGTTFFFFPMKSGAERQTNQEPYTPRPPDPAPNPCVGKGTFPPPPSTPQKVGNYKPIEENIILNTNIALNTEEIGLVLKPAEDYRKFVEENDVIRD